MRRVTPTLEFFAQTATASGAMTLSQYIEISLTHRAESDLPVRIVEHLTRHTMPRGPTRVAVGQMTQGSLAALAVISARSMSHLPAPVAMSAGSLFLVMTNAVVARLCDLAGMPWSWPMRDFATDLIHKTSLATAALLVTRGAHHKAPAHPWPLGPASLSHNRPFAETETSEKE
jgi:hypothetical protein